MSSADMNDSFAKEVADGKLPLLIVLDELVQAISMRAEGHKCCEV